MSASRRSMWHEPLLHFVLLGAALFALDFAVRESEVEAREDEILVSPGRVENLVALFVKTWQRAPTPDELRGLVRDHVLEEALYREGLALGLDRDDTVVRRRLRQKMEFVVEDIAELAQPTEEQLAEWLAEHADDYAVPAALSFRQLYFSPDRRGAAVQAEAEEILAQLRAAPDQDPRELGDATLLEHANAEMTIDDVARTYGEGFASELAQLATGEWTGPFESAYGLHLVIVDERLPGTAPALGEVRAEVERDWAFARREEAKERYNRELLDRYRVKIEWPQDLAEAGIEAAPQER